MDLHNLRKIKEIAIKAMFSDDDLMERLVLKGGNALDIIYKIAKRASLDLDFSIAGEFKEDEIELIESKIRKVLTDTFMENNYYIFDIKFAERPSRISETVQTFWGGYKVEFKIIENQKKNNLGNEIEKLRRNALVVGRKQVRTFSIDISKFEYCTGKQDQEFDGYTIYVYSPSMLVIEKLRAICQQMPEYKKIIGTQTQTARARDFFDIHALLENFTIDFSDPENISLTENIFSAKKVPLNLIGKIENYREFHRQDFLIVKDTINPGQEIRDFDFYFDFVVDKCRGLKSLWII